MIEETLLEAEEKMEKAVVVAKEDFAAIRTGRAHPAMFNKIVADYYGALTPINQLASFSVPEPRMAVVTPFDKSALRNIEQAIRDSDLGVNPSNDGNIIRVMFPELTAGAPQGVHQGRQDQGRGLQDLDPRHPPQGQGDPRQARQGRRGRRGRGPSRGEGARRHHREVRRAGGRAAQAQGSRAARSLMNDSSWGRRRQAPGTGAPPDGGPVQGAAPAGPAYDAHDAQQTRPMPIVPDVPDAWRSTQDDDRGAARPGGPLFRDEMPQASPTGAVTAEAASPCPRPTTPSSPPRPQKKRAGRDLRAAIGVGVGLGAVIVALAVRRQGRLRRRGRLSPSWSACGS